MSAQSTDTQTTAAAAEITEAAPSRLPKVQLDIDDAPFLREAEPEAPPPPPKPDIPLPEPSDGAAPAPDAAAAKKKKKRLILIAAAGLVLLIAGGAALWWFVLRTPPPPPVQPQVVVVPNTTGKAPAPSEFFIGFAPFRLELVETAGKDKGKIVFLVCKFTAVTSSEAVLAETQNKVIVLRDALYFYLKNKEYAFLADPLNTPTIKSDLVSVLNGYLATGKVEDVLFERYLSQ